MITLIGDIYGWRLDGTQTGKAGKPGAGTQKLRNLESAPADLRDLCQSASHFANRQATKDAAELAANLCDNLHRYWPARRP